MNRCYTLISYTANTHTFHIMLYTYYLHTNPHLPPPPHSLSLSLSPSLSLSLPPSPLSLSLSHTHTHTHTHPHTPPPPTRTQTPTPTHPNTLWYRTFKGSQLGAFCPKAIVYCYLEFKLRFLKNLKLFSIRVKELFEPMERKKSNGIFALFKRIFLRKLIFE